MADYLFEPIDTDPIDIFNEFVDYMQSIYPEWDPSTTQLDYMLGMFFSLKAAAVADMASRVMRGVYMKFGETIVNIPPLAASEAQVSFNFTAVDTLGHIIPADTQLGLRDSLGDIHIFTTLADATIPAGSSSVAGVTAAALDPGADSNTLSGTVEVVEQFDWLSSVTVAAPSSGGVDEEDEETYLNRLTANLGLMAPRPILATDFALISRNVPGVWRAIALDNFIPGTNEVQTISHNYTGTGATGGTITWSGQTTAALPFNASAAQVQTALEALNNVEPGDVVATGGPWPAAITLTWGGRYAYTDVAQITASAGTWTGGTTITIATTVAGTVANFAAENAVAVAAVDSGGTPIVSAKKTELDTYLQSLLQQNFIVNILDPNTTTVDITYVGVAKAGYDKADVKSRADDALKLYFDPTTWGVPSNDSRGWDRQTAIRGQELYTVLNNVEGMDYISTLTFSNGTGATQDGADKTIGGIFPIARYGTINGTVN